MSEDIPHDAVHFACSACGTRTWLTDEEATRCAGTQMGCNRCGRNIDIPDRPVSAPGQRIESGVPEKSAQHLLVDSDFLPRLPAGAIDNSPASAPIPPAAPKRRRKVVVDVTEYELSVDAPFDNPAAEASPIENPGPVISPLIENPIPETVPSNSHASPAVTPPVRRRRSDSVLDKSEYELTADTSASALFSAAAAAEPDSPHRHPVPTQAPDHNVENDERQGAD